ncbi:MAG: metallophosphoesterase family protein [Polyangiaceae bacterium]
MQPMRFVHAADLHVDSPLRGLERYEGAPVELAREATRAAVKNLVDLCLREDAAFLLVSGDLFDGDWKDFHTPLFLVSELARLKAKNIRAFVVLGNHDLQSELVPHIRWPDNVTVFGAHRADTCILHEYSAAIHGRSYARAAVSENLAASYPPPLADHFNIALLHTNAAGAAGAGDHASYAPCRGEELRARGYDYWALGHVHGHQVLSTSPHVVYPGNLQGRNARETGEKGAVVVDVEDRKVKNLRFVPCDVMRWARIDVDADATDAPREIVDKVRTAVSSETGRIEGRALAARVTVKGACEAHAALARMEDRARFVADVRAAARDASERAWIEKVQIETSSLADVDTLRAARDLVGDLLRSTRDLANSGELAKALEPLFLPLRAKMGPALDDAGVRLDDPDRLRKYIAEAETILVDLLAGDRSG